MGKFVYFTSAEKRQANEVDLPSFLLDRGEKLSRSPSRCRMPISICGGSTPT